MSRIDIRHPHSLSKAKARKAIEDVARKLAEKFDMDYGWEGDTLNFSRSGVDGHIVLGPGDITCAHQPGEHLEMSRLQPTVRLLSQLIEHYCLTPAP